MKPISKKKPEMRVVLLTSLVDVIEGDDQDPESAGPMSIFIPAGSEGTMVATHNSGKITVSFDAVFIDADVNEFWEWTGDPVRVGLVKITGLKKAV